MYSRRAVRGIDAFYDIDNFVDNFKIQFIDVDKLLIIFRNANISALNNFSPIYRTLLVARVLCIAGGPCGGGSPPSAPRGLLALMSLPRGSECCEAWGGVAHWCTPAECADRECALQSLLPPCSDVRSRR